MLQNLRAGLNYVVFPVYKWNIITVFKTNVLFRHRLVGDVEVRSNKDQGYVLLSPIATSPQKIAKPTNLKSLLR